MGVLPNCLVFIFVIITITNVKCTEGTNTNKANRNGNENKIVPQDVKTDDMLDTKIPKFLHKRERRYDRTHQKVEDVQINEEVYDNMPTSTTISTPQSTNETNIRCFIQIILLINGLLAFIAIALTTTRRMWWGAQHTVVVII
ncbi:uncharacterized protein LOC117107768 isoform X3 [Anneissia japonica]|uniref:uncharacterized protein LOC117107768 isoform X3 n=1 Tax=Anneissia japonica TaxID=1529436 RepID=UPI001425BAF8|nr:uncharacterized protein LOC117107768 isoform X3 [Anneissia japonica]